MSPSEPTEDNGVLDQMEGLCFFPKYDDGITASAYEPIFTKEQSRSDSAAWLKRNLTQYPKRMELWENISHESHGQ